MKKTENAPQDDAEARSERARKAGQALRDQRASQWTDDIVLVLRRMGDEHVIPTPGLVNTRWDFWAHQ